MLLQSWMQIILKPKGLPKERKRKKFPKERKRKKFQKIPGRERKMKNNNVTLLLNPFLLYVHSCSCYSFNKHKYSCNNNRAGININEVFDAHDFLIEICKPIITME